MHPDLFAARMRAIGYVVVEHVLTLRVEHVHCSTLSYESQLRRDIADCAPGAQISASGEDRTATKTRTWALVPITRTGGTLVVGGALDLGKGAAHVGSPSKASRSAA